MAFKLTILTNAFIMDNNENVVITIIIRLRRLTINKSKFTSCMLIAKFEVS